MLQTEKYVLSVDARIGELVRMWLFRKEVQQRDLAKVLDLTSATASRKIAGKTAWSATDIAKTAAFLDLPVSELMPDDVKDIVKASAGEPAKALAVAGAGFEPTTSGL